MRIIDVDINIINNDIDIFHDVICEKLEFPYYYGRNKDAFWDCLTDNVNDIKIIIRNYEKQSDFFKKEIDPYFYMMFLYQEKSKHKFIINIIFD